MTFVTPFASGATDLSAIAAVCEQFFDAIEQGDLDRVTQLYAADVVVWHNADEIATTREENLAVLRRVTAILHDRCYADRRVAVYETGFVQQHVLLGRLAGGEVFRLPACIVCAVHDGRITRLDEYYDQKTVDAQYGRSSTP